MALQSSADHPQPLRVVVAKVAQWVDRLGEIWVEGQLIEIKRRSGAVQFLTLRDNQDQVTAQLTTTSLVLDQAGPIVEGTTVAALVKPTVWTRSGTLSFECRRLRPTGQGRLLADIEQRKQALRAEGLFNPDLKRPLPFLPRRIGLITGAGSAAERDVVENIRRRWPPASLEIRHALVQGPQAVGQLVSALSDLATVAEVDVIIIARGGGSLEDLLPFSDETLLRAVFAVTTPVVSAIGHESDTPLLDLVADLRASTPTDAAKRVVPDVASERESLKMISGRLQRAIELRLSRERQRLAELRSRPVLRDPSSALGGHNVRLDELRRHLRRSIGDRLREEQLRLAGILQRVRTLSPSATLQRGYVILGAPDGQTVTSVAEAEVGTTLTAHLQDGRLQVTVIDAVRSDHD